MRVANLPVQTLPADGPTSQVRAPDGRYVEGVIGTSVLSHFLSTVDYANRELVLRRTASAPWGASTPLWFAGDHLLLAHGRVNDTDPMVFFVGTGGAGTGFTAPDATFSGAGTPIPPGTGPHPLTVDRLALGRTVRTDVPGLAGTFPAPLENALGFRIGGLITHRFFTPFGLTSDFRRMRLILSGGQ